MIDVLIRFRTHDGRPETITADMMSNGCIVGRKEGGVAHVEIDDSVLSRKHCLLEMIGDNLIVEDLDSSNGTWVNGEKLKQRTMLFEGDIIRIGSTSLTVELAPFDEEDDCVGREIEGYDIQSVLGKGSYGTVYKGIQTNLGRYVALKRLHPELAKDKSKRESFLTEARRAGLLNHPHLVQVHDVKVSDGEYLLVMELAEGGSAAEHIVPPPPTGEVLEESDRQKIFSIEQIMQLIIHIGRALAYAESQRIIHRDVKPANILMTADGTFKLGDLGIAAPITAHGKASQTRALGSPLYVAPEQARGGAIDARADIYGLGATVWHLLCGEPVFTGNKREVIAKHLNEPLPSLVNRVPGLNPSVVKLVTSMLSKDPSERPADGNELVALAEACVQQGNLRTIPKAGGTSGRSSRKRGATRGRRRSRGGGSRRRRRR